MNNFDYIWARLTRVLTFTLGMAIMVYEAVSRSSDRPWLYAAAAGMMGLPVAKAAADILEKFSTADKPIKAPKGQNETNGT